MTLASSNTANIDLLTSFIYNLSQLLRHFRTLQLKRSTTFRSKPSITIQTYFREPHEPQQLQQYFLCE